MRAFIELYRHAYGVEPICKVMQVAPSGYWRHAAQQRNQALRCDRAQRDEVLASDIERVWQANLQGRISLRGNVTMHSRTNREAHAKQAHDEREPALYFISEASIPSPPDMHPEALLSYM